ncbi:hypothetical protein AMAG_06850 [Allomyces macrogynus ATCC 38327]|uniref:Pentatricopeptide repeat domain-containing protein n=1 Tax=Allomyces macrogynus (strain ATCC 38327) TaxID=578462 RepID=A0A0L0SF14_ALLM3|nr:hypothetical protein AMAG_06850 [Allomyces macrogynus ATCC 38327]|eukprot:KNE61096.1 hypothetical protein AMAG_06850 [Allomyces macrogynus ATCC 38327]
MTSMPLTTMRKLARLTAGFAHNSPLSLSAHEAMRRRQRIAEDMVAYKLDDESQQWTAADFCEVFLVLHKRHSVPQFPPSYRHIERLERTDVSRLWRRITTLPMVLLDPAPYNRFLLYHLERGDSTAFQEVLDWMMQHSIHLHSFSYGQIIRMLLTQNQTETAAVMVKELVDAEYPPSSTMLCHLLHAFAMAGEKATCDLIRTAWADRLTNASADDLVSLVDLLLPYSEMRAMTLELASLALARIEPTGNPKSMPQSYNDLRARSISSWLSRLIEDQSPMLADFFRVLDTQSDRVRLDTWCRLTVAATAAAVPPSPRLSFDRPPSAPPPPPPPSPSRKPNHIYWRRGSWRHFARALALTPHVLDFATPQYFLAKLLGLMYVHGAGPEAVVLIRSLVVHAPRNATRTPVVNEALRILVAFNEHHLVQNVLWPRLRANLETAPPHTVADTQTLNYLLISALHPRSTSMAVGESTATGQFANDVTVTMTQAGVPGDAVTWSLVAKWSLTNGAPGAVFAILDRAAEHRQGSAPMLNMALKAATDAAHMQVIVEFLVAHGTENKVPAPKSSSRPRSGGPREWLLVDNENRLLFQDRVRELRCDVEETRVALGSALAEVLDDVEVE